MLETTDNLLVAALSEALETMAFMMVLPPEEELPVPSDSVLVRMDFAGPSSGTVELVAGGELLAVIAANVLGVDPDDPEADSKAVDAFKEICNTTCGVLIPQLARSADDVFDVTVPESESLFGSDRWQAYVSQEGVAVLDVEGLPLALRLIGKS